MKKFMQLSICRKFTAHTAMILGLVSIAIAMRFYGLEWLFDFEGYDEGVYWQTLRSMHAGFALYDQIFYTQPPLFLISIYPFYAIFGQSIVVARAGVAVLSLLGLIGAYLIGKALASRMGALAAVVLVVFTPLYLAQSQVLDAEGPATALLFLSVGAALTWRECSLEKKKTRVVLPILCGSALSFGILIKLLNVTAFVPILMLIGWRVWSARHESGAKTLPILASVLLGFVVAILIALISLVPFLVSANTLIYQVVTFHLAATNVWQSNNFQILGQFFRSNGVLTIAAMTGAILALARTDWRVIPLTAWLAVTIGLLAVHAPLFPRHAIILIPPLIAITVLGLGDLPSLERVRGIMAKRMSWIQARALLMGMLVCAATVKAVPALYAYYHARGIRAESDEVRQTAQIAVDLRKVTAPDQWIITDGQFIVALADRNTPPSLVDTSFVRILSGDLTTHQLVEAASDPKVQVVLFATNRLTSVTNFHDWVAQHFVLMRSYSPGIELWLR